MDANILYQLTTDGDMGFNHLFDVSPWPYLSTLRGNAPADVPDPRILKTHEDYDLYPDGTKGKFIYVMRNGMDVMESFFHHRVNTKGYEGSFSDHIAEFTGRENSYNWFDHVREWVENKNRLPVYYVRYEDLKTDPEGTIRGIAEYCGIPVNDEIIQRTLKRTSFALMKEHEAKFAPTAQLLKQQDTYKIKNQAQYATGFIRRGETGKGASFLTYAQIRAYQARFDETLGHLEPLASYRGNTPLQAASHGRLA